MLTVRDALKLDVFQRSKVVAGKQKLDNTIAAVTVLEVTSDDIAVWAKSNELWITSFYSIAEDVDHQIYTMKILHEKGAAGIVICGLGYFFSEVSPRLIEAADEIGMPLIVMPPESAYEEVINAVMSVLLNSRKEELVQTLQVQRAMNSMVLRNGSLEHLLQFLESALTKELAFIDNEHKLIYPLTKEKRSLIKAHFTLPQATLKANGGAEDLLLYRDHCVYYSIQSYGYYYGTILVLQVEKSEVEHVHLMLANCAASIMLVNTAKKSSLLHNELAFKHFFHLLELKELSDPSAIFEHAERIALNLYHKHFIAVIHTEDNPSQIADEIKHIVDLDRQAHELIYFDQRLVLLYDCDAKEKGQAGIKQLCFNICRTLKSKESATIGVSRYYGAWADIGTAYRQALQAIEIGRRIFTDEACFFHEQLGIYPLILDHYRLSEEGLHVKSYLDILDKYDKKYGSTYLSTLKSLFLIPGNLENIAAKLYIHKNTLLYRKNKIIHLLGHDPFLMPYQLDYQIYFIAERLHAPLDADTPSDSALQDI